MTLSLGCICTLLAASGVLFAAAPEAFCAGTVMVPGPSFGNLEVRVTSMKEAHFGSTLQQQYDYSCGSAALATLLSHHYEYPVSEAQVFRDMYAKGDREKIRREGFSLLDMKIYLEAKGFQADGFRISLDQLKKVGVPAIVLINRNGFKHFVVVQGVSPHEVLVGDPATGTRVVSRKEFQQIWNGLVFLVRNKKEVGQRHFNTEKDWSVQVRAPLKIGLAGGQAMSDLLFMPLRNGY